MTSDFDALFLLFNQNMTTRFIRQIVTETILFDIQNAQMDENKLPDSFK